MGRTYKLGALVALLMAIAGLLLWLTQGHTIAVLQPKGVIAEQQRDLLLFAVLLSLVVIVPVYVLTIGIVWKYRAGNKKAPYTPEWDSDRRLETAWWGIPCIIILILSVITWQTSHSLDPYRPISSSYKPVTIQVVALQYKWLFIYPEQNIATVGYVQFPEDTAVNFQITSDAPMNSFWIPQLGGQVYAMSGMRTQLHLLASEQGTYNGLSANLSGEGHAGMTFTAHATSQEDFYTWIQQAKASSGNLTASTYRTIAAPDHEMGRATYATVQHNLYDSIVMKYMMPKHQADAPAGHRKAEQTHEGNGH